MAKVIEITKNQNENEDNLQPLMGVGQVEGSWLIKLADLLHAKLIKSLVRLDDDGILRLYVYNNSDWQKARVIIDEHLNK